MHIVTHAFHCPLWWIMNRPSHLHLCLPAPAGVETSSSKEYLELKLISFALRPRSVFEATLSQAKMAGRVSLIDPVVSLRPPKKESCVQVSRPDRPFSQGSRSNFSIFYYKNEILGENVVHFN